MTDPTYYPPPAFAFSVAIAAGTALTAVDAAFMEVSGIDPKVDVEEVPEGGVNDYVHQLPGVTKHSNLVLKRGYVTASSSIADWASQTIGTTLNSGIQTKTVIVTLMSPSQAPVVTWTFMDAWPIKWEVGTFDASRNEVLTETLEISYTTVTRKLEQAITTQGSGK